MSKRKNADENIEMTGDNAADPHVAPEPTSADNPADNPANNETKNEIPTVESPSISPAISEPVAIDEEGIEPKAEPEVDAVKPAQGSSLVAFAMPSGEQTAEPFTEPASPRFTFKARHKRNALLAASVAMAAALGVVAGVVMSGGFAAQQPPTNVVGLEENKAMHQSVAQLAKEVTTLKARVEATNKRVEAANKLAQSQVAKISERLRQESSEITGSISSPQTVAPPPVATAPVPSAPAPTASVPTPRPAPRIAAAESQPPARLQVVHGWSIRATRGGYVYVEGRGELYQVVPGASLPGLGMVESIKRLDGRWVVTTPKGIIVAMRDRRYFE